MLPREVAAEIAEGLHGIQNAPRSEGAKRATAKDLTAWCKGCIIDGLPWTEEQQANWLVDEARAECDTWPGPRGLRRIFDAKFNPPPELRSSNNAAPETPSCPICSGTGWRVIKVGNLEGVAVCDCRANKQ